uniref:Uncharacterized protein n=1 Tax=Nuksystermes virus TaxID=2796622 RepID=A0A894KJU6_9VIRU|nr:hypothetical protein 2 [Nuksystermes virus]
MEQKVPPETTKTPQMPPPQTVTGVVEQEGQDIAPLKLVPEFVEPQADFWCWVLTRDLTLTSNGSITSFSFDFSSDLMARYWPTFLMSSSKWCNFVPLFRFWIVKPPRVVGRIHLRYRPLDTMDGAAYDVPLRDINYEWDLAKSDYIDVPMTSFGTSMNMRPTFIQRTPKPDETTWNTACIVPPPINWEFGRIYLNVAQPMKAGSVFPDTYTVIVLVKFMNIEMFEIGDFRWHYSNQIKPIWNTGNNLPYPF